jgi:parallel beta-helix repeat protein
MTIRSWLKATTLAGALALFIAVNAPQALATHVKCGDVITQDTTLDSDLLDCPSDGIVIGAANITLDLNGHTVDGDGVGVDQGLDNAAGHDAVTLKGPGRVQAFTVGVELTNASHNLVSQLELSDNRFFGMSLSGHTATDNLVDQNTVFRNYYSGISVDDEYGLNIDAGRNRLRRNTVFQNQFYGVLLSGEGDGNRIERNLITNNEWAGILLSDSFGTALLARNFVSDNCAGIELIEVQDARIEKNRAVRNGGDCAASGKSDGIWVGGDSSRNVVRRNVASENQDDGIDIEDPPNTVSGNRADRNGDLGIEAVPGTIDGGGNRAKGNGNPLQCLNVDCK